MKKPFDRIVGPEGEWIDGEGTKKPDRSAEDIATEWHPTRDEFILRCLNAAINLRGVMTFSEFCEIYNEYAEDHESPVSDALDENELGRFMSRVADSKEGDDAPFERLIEEFGINFACWEDDKDGASLVVKRTLVDVEDDIRKSKIPPTDKEIFSLIDKRVAVAREAFAKMDFPHFDEDAFLSFEFMDDEDGDYDAEEGELVKLEELPPAKYIGPVDFKFVKDPAKREKAICDYDGVRAITSEFVRHVVMQELTQEERRDAAKRLGFMIDSKTGFVNDANLNMVTGDFAAMMDDQHGEPAIRRVLSRVEKLDEYDRAAAAYYENYRYTWLDVLAVKAGVGMKCRDLLTGEELFLMEKSFSLGDVKGSTICAGIAPMGDVYLILGVIHPANFENPVAVMKILLSHLGLPTEQPIQLSFADQARFAAETIHRIHSNGRFDNIAYGGLS